MSRLRRRRIVAAIILVLAFLAAMLSNPENYQILLAPDSAPNSQSAAIQALDQLEVKGRAPKTGYSRQQFGDGWQSQAGCDMRNIILVRDLEGEVIDDDCRVLSGQLNDPYSGKVIKFKRGLGSSSLIQIDHVVSLSDAWQKGAQALEFDERRQLANDPLNLLAVDGAANQAKSDGDAATWLPANKSFRCQYVARQIAVKLKYKLWVNLAEKLAIKRVLNRCPGQSLPTP